MNRNLEDVTISIIGREPILEDEIFNSLKGIGVENLISYDFSSGNMEMEVDGDLEARLYLPLDEARILDSDFVFIVGKFEKKCLSFLKSGQSKSKLFILSETPIYDDSYEGLNIVSPETLIIKEILNCLEDFNPVSFFWSIYSSASSRGKGGLQELFLQTRDILNFQKIKNEQFAFKLVPSKPQIPEHLENELKKTTSFKGFLLRNEISVPIFYGTYLYFISELKNRVDKTGKMDAIKRFKESDSFDFETEISKITATAPGKKPLLFTNFNGENHITGFVGFDNCAMLANEVAKIVKGEVER
jgi:hypothetical protein